jgi:mannose-6-phosphate isomerase-like protein (cupin superfamily)
VSIDNGKSTQTGFHNDEEEIYVILKGRALLMIGDEEQKVGPGSVAYVPRNQKHKMTCISDEQLEYLYFANWPK